MANRNDKFQADQTKLPFRTKVVALAVVSFLFVTLTWVFGQLLFAIEPPETLSKEAIPEQLFVVVGRSEKLTPVAIDLRSIRKKAISVDGVQFLLAEDSGRFDGDYGDTKFLVEHMSVGVQKFNVVVKNPGYVAHSEYLVDAGGITPLRSKVFTADYLFQAAPSAFFVTLMIFIAWLTIAPTKIVNQRRARRAELRTPVERIEPAPTVR